MFFIGLGVGFLAGWLFFKRPEKVTEWIETFKREWLK